MFHEVDNPETMLRILGDVALFHREVKGENPETTLGIPGGVALFHRDVKGENPETILRIFGDVALLHREVKGENQETMLRIVGDVALSHREVKGENPNTMLGNPGVGWRWGQSIKCTTLWAYSEEMKHSGCKNSDFRMSMTSSKPSSWLYLPTYMQANKQTSNKILIVIE